MWKNRLSRGHQRAIENATLGLETLESRMLLSGNVLASVSDGTLSVVGDSGDNSILVSTFEDATYGTGFRVEGFYNNGDTTVNGSNSAAEFFGVTNLFIDLQDGDDELGVSNDIETLADCLGIYIEPEGDLALPAYDVNVPGWATILMGTGDNRVGIGPATVGQRLLIEGGMGNDQVGVCQTEVGTNLVVRTFGGYDEVGIFDSESAGVTKVLTANGDSNVQIDGLYANRVVVRGGYHEDNVSVSCFWVNDDVVVQTFNGYDWVYVGGCNYNDGPIGGDTLGDAAYEPSSVGDLLAIQTFDGGAEISVYAVDAGRINVLGGGEGDSISFEMVYATYNINVKTLGGDDYVSASNVNALNMTILTGTGDDNVFVGGRSNYGESYFRDDLVIITSDGDDQVRIGYQGLVGFGDQAQLDEDGVNIVDDLIVNTGDGTDYIEISYYDIGDNVTIDAGAGDDSGYRQYPSLENLAPPEAYGGVYIYDVHIYGNLNVFLGPGADSGEIEYVDVAGNAYIDAGTGDDGYSSEESESYIGNLGVSIYELNVGNNFWLNLGSGTDRGYVYDLWVGNNAFFNAGGQDDHLTLDYVHVYNNLFVFMGGGNDDLYIDDSSASSAYLFGDGGNADYYDKGSNSFGSEKIYSFEIVVS